MELPHYQIGDCVRTTRKLHRLPAGSIGTVARVFGSEGLLGVLFAGDRVPRFVYREDLDLLPQEEAGNTEL